MKQTTSSQGDPPALSQLIPFVVFIAWTPGRTDLHRLTWQEKRHPAGETLNSPNILVKVMHYFDIFSNILSTGGAADKTNSPRRFTWTALVLAYRSVLTTAA